jgi:FkbM family methyltransferase
MPNILKSFFRRVILDAFNLAFQTRLRPELICTVKRIASSGVKLADRDLESVRLITREELVLKDEHLPMLRVLNRLDHGLYEPSADFLLRVNRQPIIMEALSQPGIIEALTSVATAHRLDDVINLGEGFQICFSQEGESLILDRLFNNRNEGFYIDIGAHHPKRFSNTFSMYRRGWRGISIDPTPGLSEKFECLRRGDLFIPVAVSDIEQPTEFFQFDEPALNTFSRSLASQYRSAGYTQVSTQLIMTRRLDGILAEYALGREIDFMSIDVEGHELSVLRSNDWTRFRPRVLLVEILDFNLEQAAQSPVHSHLVDLGYKLFAKTLNTVIYKDIV